jgi:uncharacterized membrane protein YdbT with pleckstrin-like domain
MADDSRRTPDDGNPSVAGGVKNTPRELLRKLREMPLFAGLTDEQFKAVSDLLHIKKVERTKLVVMQGGDITDLYLVRHGHAVARMVDANERNHILYDLREGSIFNEDEFLTGLRNALTIEALTPLTLWTISRESFLRLLRERPDIYAGLTIPPQLPARLTGRVARHRRHHQHDWQRPNEHVAHFCHKHPWVFWRSLWPLLAMAVVMLVIALVSRLFLLPAVREAAQPAAPTVVATSQALAGDATPVLVTPTAAPGAVQEVSDASLAGTIESLVDRLVIILSVIALIYIVYEFIDWRNDYYAITDQRLIHRERTLLIRDQQSELPMNKLQNVSVDRPGILSWILDYGDLTIDASGVRSKVKFPDIGKPDQVAEIILNQSQRMHGDSHASQRVKMRDELIKELQIVPSKEEPKQGGRKHPTRPKFTLRTRRSLGNIRNAFLPHMRVVQGDTILYHKHWLQLMEVITLPAAGVLVYVALLVLLRLFVPEVAQIIYGTPLEIGVIVLGIGLLLWALYRYEDWRNDIYILTPDRIIDIDRSPFGIGASSRREARLAAVQNVNLDMTGLWDNAFDIGDVIIQTAGAEGTLTFERVYDPHGVQRDIVNYMEAQDTRARDRQMAERRREFAEWVGIYDELKKMYGDNSRQL